MNETEFKEGLTVLNQLSQEEYRESLQQVIQDEQDDEQKRLLRVGRLIGILLKEPFATPQSQPEPSRCTRAYRGWSLVDEQTFYSPERQNTWQFKTLEALLNDKEVKAVIGVARRETYWIAADAQNERGFWGYLAISCRRYICGDLKNTLEKNVEGAKAERLDVKISSPEAVVASGGFSFGVLLIQHVPILGFVGAPAIAGIVLLLYTIGVDAFCEWAKQIDIRNSDNER
jgi:hypothetical protein